MTKHYRVTMDSAKNPAILVHKNNGTHIKFTSSAHGIFKHELTEDRLSINHVWSMVTGIPVQLPTMLLSIQVGGPTKYYHGPGIW
jgi:hypothetical protein